MRTTPTIDPDAADALKKPFRVVPHRGGFRAGVDHLMPNRLADDLEAENFVAVMAKEKES